MNASPNAGRLAITLRSRDERKTPVTTIMDRLQRAVAAVPGVVVYFQPVQDIQISTRMSRAQYQYTLTGTDVQEVDDWASKLAQKLRSSAIMQDVASEAQNDGFRLDVAGRSRHRRPARNLDADHRRHLERCLRPAPDFDHLRAGEPVPRDPRGEAGISERPELAVEDLYPRHRNSGGGTIHLVDLDLTDQHSHGRKQLDGAIERGRQFRARDRPAGHRPSGAVSGRHDQLQSRPRRRAQRRGEGDLAGRTRDRNAERGHRQLFRRRRRIRKVARRRTLADPRRRGDDLYRAGRAL